MARNFQELTLRLFFVFTFGFSVGSFASESWTRAVVAAMFSIVLASIYYMTYLNGETSG